MIVNESDYGINYNARYRFYDVFKNDGSAVNISFTDEIDPAYFSDVITYGIDTAIETLGLPFAVETFLNNAGLYIFRVEVEGYEEEFKVTWHFEWKKNDFGFKNITSSELRIEYRKDGETLDAVKSYDFEIYKQALDFVMNYVQDILTNGVKKFEPPKGDENLVKNLKLMHSVMMSMNNEDAYYSWIYVVPDEPSEEDFNYIASDEDEYKDCEDTFYSLFKKYAKDGLYKPSEEEKQFAFDACKKLGIPQIEVLG